MAFFYGVYYEDNISDFWTKVQLYRLKSGDLNLKAGN